MVTITNYNPQTMHYEVCAKPLSLLEKEKVCLIEDLNKITTILCKECLSPADFDKLWDTDIDSLRNAVNDQSAVLNRYHYDNRIQGADF